MPSFLPSLQAVEPGYRGNSKRGSLPSRLCYVLPSAPASFENKLAGGQCPASGSTGCGAKLTGDSEAGALRSCILLGMCYYVPTLATAVRFATLSLPATSFPALRVGEEKFLLRSTLGRLHVAALAKSLVEPLSESTDSTQSNVTDRRCVKQGP